MLKSFVEIPTLSGHQSTWIELHAKTKHKEIYTVFTIRPPVFAFRFIVYLLTSAQNELDEQTEIYSLFLPIFDKFCLNDLTKKRIKITNPVPPFSVCVHVFFFLFKIVFLHNAKLENIRFVSIMKGKRAQHNNNSHYRSYFSWSES